ncbi:DedA family protein [Rhodococcus sp. NPDC078407]|uniref:DedA family protein n=1 Tax=Rhodococcus sp. NPDC078407 TaxID=3364509 RepID=UPI0037C4F253
MNLNLLDVDRLSTVPVWVVLVGVVVLLTFESGSLFGLFTPGNSVPITLGVLTSIGVVPWMPAVVTAAVASSMGAQWALGRSRRTGTVLGLGRVESALPSSVMRILLGLTTQVRSRPRTIAAAGHLVGGIRTVAPRLVAASDLRRREYAVISLGAAGVWATAMVSVGAWLGDHAAIRTALGYAWIPAVTIVVFTQLRRRTRSSSPEVVGAR